MSFAIVGLVPLALGVVVRAPSIRAWAATETARILDRELGISAAYDVEIRAWPIGVGLRDVVVEASDGGTPFLTVEEISVRPRLFSLLAGELDAGDVEIIGPRVRVVVRDGALQNLAYELPEPSGEASAPPTRAPFASLALTDARIDADIDGTLVALREVDVDITAEPAMAFEIALRAGQSGVVRPRTFPGREELEDAVDDDVLCKLDTRLRVDERGVLVRRAEIVANVDFDPAPGSALPCTLAEDDWRLATVSARALRVAPPPEGSRSAIGLPLIEGDLSLRVPAAIAHRFVDLPNVTGTVALDVTLATDPDAPLPEVSGRLTTQMVGLDGKIFSDHLTSELSISGDKVRLSNVKAKWSEGVVDISWAELQPLVAGIPLRTGPITIDDIQMYGLLRDLGAHPRAHVAWNLDEGDLTGFTGQLIPLGIKTPLVVRTNNFAILDRPADEGAGRRMFGVPYGVVRGEFRIEHDRVVFKDMTVETRSSRIFTTVSLQYASFVDIEVGKGSFVDMAEVSPLVDVPVSGKVHVTAGVHGPFERPLTKGELSAEGFSIAGFEVGAIESASAMFEPLVLQLHDVVVRRGQSRLAAPELVLDFQSGADVAMRASVDVREPPYLDLADFFDVFHLDEDPRWASFRGVAAGTARVEYVTGGPIDRCGGGHLTVDADGRLESPEAFGERFDNGDLSMHLTWDDMAAGEEGMSLDLHSLALRKGSGTVIAQASVRHGGTLRGNAVVSGMRLDRIDTLGSLGKELDGTLSMMGTLGGKVSAMSGDFSVDLSPIRIGPSSLPASRLALTLEPSPREKNAGVTQCNNARAAPFDPAAYERDESSGLYRVRGELFGGQVQIADLTMTQQRAGIVSGELTTRDLDLGTFANLIPGIAFSRSPPSGKLGAAVRIVRMPIQELSMAHVEARVDRLELERGGVALELTEPSKAVELRSDRLTIPELALQVETSSGLALGFTAVGAIDRVTEGPQLDVGVRIRPIELSRLSGDIDSIERVRGVAEGSFQVRGPLASPRFTGAAHLTGGALSFKGAPITLDDIAVDVVLDGSDIRVTRAHARAGSGSIEATARVPISGLSIGAATASLTARGIRLPVAQGIDITADADLEATYRPSRAILDTGERALPDVTGTVSLTSFAYTRPIAMSVDLDQFGGAKRTEVQTYDPEGDFVRFNVKVVSSRALEIQNNLVTMKLVVAEPGLMLTGTNQRFGAEGQLKILEESKIQLRANEFEVREGFVRFKDPTRISPHVELRAETEYRRYASSGGGEGEETTSTSSGASAGPGGGQWRIHLHAHGDAENLKLDLTSDPALAQEDIILLLTVGMTRAEVDRSLASSLGETVGLEALSSLTGADSAVKSAVPIIDHFHFGSGYSSRTGRTEPNVTIGKRLTTDVRANVTTTLTQSDVSSSVEWRLRKGVSVQGSYDNVNDVSGTLGNLGADLRWRLEFE